MPRTYYLHPKKKEEKKKKEQDTMSGGFAYVLTLHRTKKRLRPPMMAV